MKHDKILVVDDETTVRWSLAERLSSMGYHVVEAATGAEAVDGYDDDVGVVVLGFRLPDTDGLSVLRQLRHRDPDAIVIVLSAVTSVPTVVDVIKAGAFHYLSKPFDLDEVALNVEGALHVSRLRREVRTLRRQVADGQNLARLIGHAPPMQQLRNIIAKVATSAGTTVLLTGESGTGKDLAARAIHGGSERAAKPFMNITCSALPDSLFEKELFGHERGAFTDAKQMRRGLLESGNGGTIFLDEVGELTLQQQTKLLRVLEDRHFKRVGGTVDIPLDVRVIAATNRQLEDAVSKGTFREDLYYRLNVIRVSLPALRERPSDIPLLVSYFVDLFSQEIHTRVRDVSPDALDHLAARPWPGNVRELRNAVEHATLMAEGDRLTLADFPLPARGHVSEAMELPPDGLHIDELERSLVTQALHRTKGNRTGAGRLLGLTREQIRYRIDKFGIADVPPAYGVARRA